MGRRLALLIATYEYEDTGLRRLTTPAHDAEALAAVLEDPEIAGFEVRTLVNAPTHEVGEAIAEFYADSRRDDLTLLYFTGHGLKDDNGRLHLAMSNTRRDRLRFTALSAQLVDEAMTDSLSRQKILILDCCYSGAYATQQFAKADSAVHTLETLGGRGRTVLTASDSTQYAFEGSTIHGDAAQSVFTRHLVEGLRDGTADLDRDGDITVDELYNYVFDRVTAEQPNQRPKKLDQVEGRTVIAANVNWSLPSHLADALTSPIAASRLAAIESLGQLLWANNELVRRTARQQLEALLADDSRAVSDAAQATLDASGPPPPSGPMPIAAVPARPTRTSSAEATSVRSAMRALLRRRLTQLGRLAMPTGSRLVGGLNLLATAVLVAAIVVGFIDGRWLGGASWYLVAVGVVMVASLLIQGRVGAENALAFVVGLAPPGLLGAALILGWLTGWMSPFIGGDLSGEPVVATLAAIGHLAWIASGVVALRRLRDGGIASLSVRRIAGLQAWIVIGLGVAAAVAQLVIRAYNHYASPLAFRGNFPVEFQWKWSYPISVGILAAELAIVGPLLGAMMSPAKFRRAFLGGWVLGGFALWLGMSRRPDGFVPPLVAVVALLVVWLLLAVQVIVGSKADELAPDGLGGPPRGLVLAIAAMLVLPAVLGAAASTVGPRAAETPLAVGLVVSLNNDYLFAADVANGKVIKINTTSRQQEGDALSVGQQPTGLTLSPDGQRLYVASGLSNSVTAIDVRTWRAGKAVSVAPKPLRLALSEVTHRLFVLSPEAQTITVVDTTTMTTVGGPVSASGGPSDLAVSPSGERLFVANQEANSVAVLDATTMRPARAPIKVDDGPRELSMSSTGQLYTVGQSSYRVINTTVANPRPSSKPLPGRASDAVLTADDSRLFVLGTDASLQKQTVTAIDTKSNEVVGSLTDDLKLSFWLAVSNDGQRIYVSGYSPAGILIIDAVALKAVGTIGLTR